MSTARRNTQQQVGYLRFTVNWNDAGIAAGVKKQTLPKGAQLIGTDVNIVTAFNAGTTNVLTVGSTGVFTEIVAAADVTEGTVALTQNIKPTGIALVPLAADLPVYVQYTQTGTAASAGQAVVVIKYIPNNDL
jgi:hypothetical protein